jgi:hypothetical protein
LRPIAEIIVALFAATGSESTLRFQTFDDGKIEQAERGGIGPAVAGGVVGVVVGGAVDAGIGATVGAAVGARLGATVGSGLDAVVGFEVDGIVVGVGDCPPDASAVGPVVGPELGAKDVGSAPLVGSPGVVLPTAMMPRGTELDPPGSAGVAAAVPSATGLGDARTTTIARMATSGRPSKASRVPRLRMSPD